MDTPDTFPDSSPGGGTPPAKRCESGSPFRFFCRDAGLRGGDASAQFDAELNSQLQLRLRSAALIVCGGFAAFLVRTLFGADPEMATPLILYPHVAVTLLTGMAAIPLWRDCQHAGRMLRLLEFTIFGAPAAFFVWMQHVIYTTMPADQMPQFAAAFPTRTVLPSVVLMFIYALYVPNTLRRAAIVIGIMAALPLLGAFDVARMQPVIARQLYELGGFSGMLLWLAISAVTAIYGSYRFGRLRREAFDAQQLGAYTLQRKLGSGGMGDVYLAEHRLLKRPCAVKLIRPEKAGDRNAIARFEDEVQAAARLTHPGTIEIYDYGVTADGTFYYAMEYLPGLNLQEMVDRFGPLPADRVIHLLAQVCSALGESHSLGLIHRDIKPGNIFAAERGRLHDVAKLLDFGLVKLLKKDVDGTKLTMDGALVGSPLYAAPETMVDDAPSPQSDIYSLGATAYFLLSGRPVFEGDNPLRVLFAHANQPIVPLSQIRPDVPADLAAIVHRCLAKEPRDRFADVDELAAALSACAAAGRWTEQRAADWWSRHDVTSAEPPAAPVDATAATTIMPRWESDGHAAERSRPQPAIH